MYLYTFAIIYVLLIKCSGQLYSNSGDPNILFPFQAALITDGSKFCSGSLISENYILTSAECVKNAFQVDVIIGTHNIAVNSVNTTSVISTEFIIHSNFDPETFINNIAMIKLPKLLTNALQIDYPKDNCDDYSGKMSTISGWSITTIDGTKNLSDELNYLESMVLSPEQCQEKLNNTTFNYQIIICIAIKSKNGFCFWDSGSPLIVEGIVVGVESITVGNCKEGIIYIYTKVSAYINWLQSILGD